MHDDPLTPDSSEEKPPEPPLSFRTAMAIYAVLAAFCVATLHGDALYLTLIIVGALALKTWLAQVKRRIDQ